MKACQVGSQKVLVSFHKMRIHSEQVLVDLHPPPGGMKAWQVGAQKVLVTFHTVRIDFEQSLIDLQNNLPLTPRPCRARAALANSVSCCVLRARGTALASTAAASSSRASHRGTVAGSDNAPRGQHARIRDRSD